MYINECVIDTQVASLAQKKPSGTIKQRATHKSPPSHKISPIYGSII